MTSHSVNKFCGGAGIGYSFLLRSHTTWPFCEISVSKDGIVIDSPFFRRVTLDSSHVQAVKQKGPVVGFILGLRIIHTCPDVDNYVSVWTPRLGALVDSLKAHGYSLTR